MIRFLHMQSFLAFLILGNFALAYPIPEHPRNSYVFDEPDLLTVDQELQFNEWAEGLHRQAGFGLAIAILRDIGEEDYRSVAHEIASKWGLGNKESSEAALIFVALKQKRRSIEVGYGAEPYLTDLETHDIQESYLVPAFKQGRYDIGILATAQAIAQKVALAKQTPISPLISIKAPRQQSRMSAEEEAMMQFFQKHPLLFILLVLLVLLIKSRTGGFIHRPGGFGGGFGTGSRGGGRSSFGGGFGSGRFGGGGSGGSW